MNISVYNKKYIESQIERLTLCLEMEAFVKSKIELFKHRKQINKTFVDAIKEGGYYCYIVEEYGYKKFICGFNKWNGKDYVQSEFYCRPYEGGLSWQSLLNEFDRDDYEGSLEQYQHMLTILEDEIIEFEKLVKHIQSLDFKCIYFEPVQRAFGYALENLKQK